jgi:cellulose 1,4-beta-cellobiosidase
MNTTTSATPYALSLSIIGTAGAISHTASTTLLVNLAAPASLAATAGNAQVSLSWPASVGATSYHVKRARVSGGPYVIVSCTTTTSYTDSGVVNGTTYYYVVSAAYVAGPNAGGESADSSGASATPQAQTSVPAAPTNLKASPGNPRRSVSLSWTQSTTPGVTQNWIYRATIKGGPYSRTAMISPATSYVDTGLTSGATYCYVVTAVKSGVESAKSNEACASAK